MSASDLGLSLSSVFFVQSLMSCVLNNGDPLQDHDILSDILHFVIAIVAVVGYPCHGMGMALGLYRPPLI